MRILKWMCGGMVVLAMITLSISISINEIYKEFIQVMLGVVLEFMFMWWSLAGFGGSILLKKS